MGRAGAEESIQVSRRDRIGEAIVPVSGFSIRNSKRRRRYNRASRVESTLRTGYRPAVFCCGGGTLGAFVTFKIRYDAAVRTR